MLNYKVWTMVALSGSVLALAQAADQKLVQPWPYGAYDKNIEIERQVPPSRTQALAATEVPSADEVLVQAKQEH